MTPPMAETATKVVETPALDFESPIVDLERKIEELVRVGGAAPELRPQIRLLEVRARKLQKEIFAELTPWQKVQLARHPARPYTMDYIDRLFEGFIELHGDRRFRDDPAIIGGFGTFDGVPVLVLGHQKGRNTKENMHRNFGMARPRAIARRRASWSWRRAPPADHLLHRHAGRVPGHRRRGARPGRGDREEPAGDGAPARADRLRRDRRGRLGRRAGARRRAIAS